MGKICGIGFHKTGTKSLGMALRTLGYTVVSYSFVDDPEVHDRAKLLDKALPLMSRYDACEDNPWPLLFRELDVTFPDSRFILTTRDETAWYASAVRQFGGASSEMRKLIYGEADPTGQEDLYLRRFRQHRADVLDYFKDRQDSLLVMDITAGDGWERLCPFLDLPHPGIPFPKENVARRPTRNG